MVNETPSISVVMSVYNGEKYIIDTINSVLKQTYKNFEFIIVNDCSTDGTLKVLKFFQDIDSRIVIINNSVNLKLPASLNKGIDKARGKYIARIDADDICLPERLDKQYSFIQEHPEYDFIGSLVECFYDGSIEDAYSNKKDMETIHFNYISETKDPYDTYLLIKKNTYKTTRLCHSSLFGKTAIFKELKYTVGIFAEDWDLYNRAILCGYKITKVPEVLVKYRIVNSGMCGQFNAQSYSEMRNKIKKLNNGILLFSLNNLNLKYAMKFFLYHYVRYRLFTSINYIRSLLLTMFKKPTFFVMKKIYKNLNINQLKLLYKVLNKMEGVVFFKKIPFFNRVLSLSLLVLRNNPKIIAKYHEAISNDERVNIGIWTVEKKWVMGGLNTILKLIPRLSMAEKKIRIINYGLHSENLKNEFIEFITDNFGEVDIEIVSALTYRSRVSEFNVNDRFICGFWESAEDFIKFRDLKHFMNDKFVYILQDYEPSMLFRWGSEYIRSKNTLTDKNYYPVFNNSVFVHGYMKKMGLVGEVKEYQLLHGEPCETKPTSPDLMIKNDIKIVFYARPTVDKNIYDIKINALYKLIDYVKEYLPNKFENMELVGIGEDANDVEYNGKTIINLGKVKYSEYPDLLNKFNVGLSCIISPAFAYPCIEFPRSGLVTVINRFENRDLEIFSNNIISCEPNADDIFRSLVIAIDKISDTETRYKSSFFELPGVGIDEACEKMMESTGI